MTPTQFISRNGTKDERASELPPRVDRLGFMFVSSRISAIGGLLLLSGVSAQAKAKSGYRET